jgi:broad specificity phosphatase PhoE
VEWSESSREDLLDYKNLAIQYCNNAILHAGNCDAQIIRIKSLLLLIKLHRWEILIQKDYFYNAVEIANHYFSDTLWNTFIGKEIIVLFLSDIDPDFSITFPEEYIQKLIWLIQIKILSVSNQILQARLVKITNTEEYLKESDSIQEIICKLDEAFGPIRLLIVSQESDEVLINHGFETSDIKNLLQLSKHIRYATVNIFDNQKRYSILIDRGSDEDLNQLNNLPIQHIIEKIVEKWIKVREYSLSWDASDNNATIDSVESNIMNLSQRGNYNNFISLVIKKYWKLWSSKEIEIDAMENYIQAINICRIVRVNYMKDDLLSKENISQQIDTILWGRICRKVLQLAQTMLLSNTETMNGSGYPYGLGKKDIPLGGRIYSIIRVYEALCYIKKNNTPRVLLTMKEWWQGGYFDTDILTMFFENLENKYIKNVWQSSLVQSSSAQSSYRKKHYEKCIDSWYYLMKLSSHIEEAYDEVRRAEGDIQKQNIMYSKISKLKQELLQKSLTRKVIIITRHGETATDVPGWTPWSDDENISQEGIESSHFKWELLSKIKFDTFSSPLERARQSVAIIVCQKANGCEQICASCSNIHFEESLRNPIKSRDNGRDGSFLERLIADNPSHLLKFIKRHISSPEESTSLLVTHRDTARHAILIIKNLLSQEQVHGEKTLFDNDTILTYLIKWGQLIEWNLFFTITDWEIVVRRLNHITESLFWEEFYKGDFSKRVDLVILHDEFLDFLDFHLEKSEERFLILIEKLEESAVTKYLGNTLRKSVFVLS